MNGNVQPPSNQNSYFFHADANPRFNAHVQNKIDENKLNNSKNIDWCTTSTAKHTPHCTLGYIYGSNNANFTALNKKIKQEVSEALKACPHSLLTKVDGFRITSKGWVILTFKPKKKLQETIHNAFVKLMENMGMQPSQFSKQNYLPHVSIGRLRPGADQNEAIQELQQLFDVIQKDPLPFIIYNIGLEHSLNKQNHPVLDVEGYKLPKRNLGIIKVEHVGNNNNIITLNSKEKAEKLAHKLFKYYGVDSVFVPGQPKKIKQLDSGEYTIQIDDRSYQKAQGHFSNLTIADSTMPLQNQPFNAPAQANTPLQTNHIPSQTNPTNAAPHLLPPKVSPQNKQNMSPKVQQQVITPITPQKPFTNLNTAPAKPKAGQKFFSFAFIGTLFNTVSKWFFNLWSKIFG